jgi:hypothetical protein
MFLDFEKAYDRLDRGWLFGCMEAMQFPDSSVRWVRLLLEGTCGQVVFNGGHHSRVFSIPSGCAQGSPLSPLLYVIAAQPLAAKCRQLQREDSVDSISLPGGEAASCSQQHADDTTLHARTVAGVRTLLRRAVNPYCAASGAKLNPSKCQAMVLGTHPPLVGADAETGVVFVDTAVTPIRHLGVLLSVSGGTAFAERLFEQRLASITHRARLWSRYDLSLLGRCEVARQVLASCLVYHAQFIPVPERIMGLLQRRIKAFTLGIGCLRSSDSRRLVYKPAAAVACLPVKRGGIGHVDVAAHVTGIFTNRHRSLSSSDAAETAAAGRQARNGLRLSRCSHLAILIRSECFLGREAIPVFCLAISLLSVNSRCRFAACSAPEGALSRLVVRV